MSAESFISVMQSHSISALDALSRFYSNVILPFESFKYVG